MRSSRRKTKLFFRKILRQPDHVARRMKFNRNELHWYSPMEKIRIHLNYQWRQLINSLISEPRIDQLSFFYFNFIRSMENCIFPDKLSGSINQFSLPIDTFCIWNFFSKAENFEGIFEAEKFLRRNFPSRMLNRIKYARKSLWAVTDLSEI